MPIFNKKSLIGGKTGATMFELIIVLFIMSAGIIALMSVVQVGTHLTTLTEQNIKAINIAREGIEAVINIRNTNWLRFSSDRKNCWNAKDYDGTCIGGLAGSKKFDTGSYTPYLSGSIWFLSGMTNLDTPEASSNWSTYYSKYRVALDGSGMYTQTGITGVRGCDSTILTGCTLIFTREIHLSYPTSNSINIQSVVRWISHEGPKDVNLKTTITNWKEKF